MHGGYGGVLYAGPRLTNMRASSVLAVTLSDAGGARTSLRRRSGVLLSAPRAGLHLCIAIQPREAMLFFYSRHKFFFLFLFLSPFNTHTLTHTPPPPPPPYSSAPFFRPPFHGVYACQYVSRMIGGRRKCRHTRRQKINSSPNGEPSAKDQEINKTCGAVYAGMGPDFRLLVRKAENVRERITVSIEHQPTRMLVRETADVMRDRSLVYAFRSQRADGRIR